MSRIIISSPDAERIAKSFNDLIGPRGLDRIRRKAVNTVGSRVRKETRAIGSLVFGTGAVNLQVQGKAAAPGSEDPRYALRLATRFPVEKLRANRRRLTRSRGRRRLVLTLPGGDRKIAFRSVERADGRFRLPAAGPLRARRLGGIYTNPRTAFERYPELAAVRREAARDLPDVVDAAINEHLARRRR